MRKNRIITVGELVLELKNQFIENGELVDSNYGMYTASRLIDCELSSETICCIAENITITEDDEEVYPCFAVENNMESYISEELINDVISSFLSLKINASVDELITALNYYLEHDCFMTPAGNISDPFQKPKLILEKAPSDKKVLLKIKNIFKMSLSELLSMTEKAPIVLSDSLTFLEAKKIIDENCLGEWIKVKY